MLVLVIGTLSLSRSDSSINSSPLAVSYRSTRQVMELARLVLGDLAPDVHVRDTREGAPVELIRFQEQGETVAFLADSLKSLRTRERRFASRLSGAT